MTVTIFDLGLSVEAVSLFLLVEGMEGNKIDPEKNCTAKKEAVSIAGCLEKWNGHEADFNAALKELEDAGTIKNSNSQLHITKPHTWKTK